MRIFCRAIWIDDESRLEKGFLANEQNEKRFVASHNCENPFLRGAALPQGAKLEQDLFESEGPAVWPGIFCRVRLQRNPLKSAVHGKR